MWPVRLTDLWLLLILSMGSVVFVLFCPIVVGRGGFYS